MKIQWEETDRGEKGWWVRVSIPVTFFLSAPFSMHFTFTSSHFLRAWNRLSGEGGGVILIMAYIWGGSAQKRYLFQVSGILKGRDLTS